jgi:hypothetical protein
MGGSFANSAAGVRLSFGKSKLFGWPVWRCRVAVSGDVGRGGGVGVQLRRHACRCNGAPLHRCLCVAGARLQMHLTNRDNEDLENYKVDGKRGERVYTD